MKYYLRIFIIFSLTIVIVGSFYVIASLAANYSGSGFFHDNQINRCHYGTYRTENQNAAAKWSSETDIDIYYDCSKNVITTYGLDYGYTGWAGYAYICDTYGNCDLAHPNFPYASCRSRNNVHELRTWTYSERSYVALHELGHCWSLAHRDSDSTSVMRYGQHSIIQPNPTDIELVNARY
ncbi:MAG: hypothetical protein B6242_11115 [Anaerolineaceae bacterium 4572_78]|nr:MAG: hypothetical protein B6242_11115 [Anaerolineaceae bacterium 4572_78]